MIISIGFTFLKIVGNAKTGSRNRFLQSRTLREQNNRLELIVTTSNFDSEIMKPSCQSSTTLGFVASRYQLWKLARTITVNMFIEKAKATYVWEVGK